MNIFGRKFERNDDNSAEIVRSVPDSAPRFIVDAPPQNSNHPDAPDSYLEESYTSDPDFADADPLEAAHNHAELSDAFEPDSSFPEDTAQSAATKTVISKAHAYAQGLQEDIRESVERQQRSVERAQGLAVVLEQIELKLAAYQRMESRLSVTEQTNIRLKREGDHKSKRADDIELQLKTLQQQYTETRRQVESSQSDLAVQNDFMRAQKERLSKLKQLLMDAAAKLSESDARYKNLSSVHKRLQSEFQAQGVEGSQKSRQIIELQKSYETVSLKLSSRTKDLEVLHVGLSATKSEYAEVKGRFFEANTQIENLRYDFRAQKAVLENQLKRREEDNLALKAQLDNLTSQIRVAGNMTSHREREIVDLQNTIEAERERLQLTETRLVEKAQESTINARALERTKLEYEILNEKYSNAVSDVEMLRSMALAQNDKLSRFAAIAGSHDPQLTHSHQPSYAPQGSENIPSPESPQAPSSESDSGTFDPQFTLKPNSNVR